MKNRRYESFQISRCDPKSNRSCIKNQMMMWWDEIQLINQMIKSSDLLIFFEKTNFSNRFSIRYLINSSHHLNFYHCIASFIYLSTDHNHRQLIKNRNNHTRSNHEKMQSFSHIHEWNRHRQSNRRFNNDDHFFDVEHVFYNDEQKTDLFEIAHWDHDLLWRNNETRSRFERNWESF
jgi:hypothetical protein